MEQITCPWCNTVFSKEFLYCPHCGVKVDGSTSSVSLGKQISIYFVSIFLPPFGLIPSLKYIFNKNTSIKRVGLIALGLTIVSTLLSVWLTFGLISQVNSSVNSQMEQYQNLGQ